MIAASPYRMPSHAYRTAPVASSGMPPGIPYIVGNEAAERFSFYGMRTILVVFMTQYLWLMGPTPGGVMSDAEANEKGHLFVTAVYATPLLGALLADLFLGKYRTIIYLSLVYCLGHACLAFMGVTGEAGHWLFAGLALISLGSGGIKPCVSAHVGDQFGQSNQTLMSRVFNWFYWSINFGAFLSTILTPWLLHWYGPHWAFGVPGVLMALATLIFWMGRRRFVHIPARGQGFAREMFSAEGFAALGKLFVIYLFVAMFWALFDQTMTSWVLQAEDMDRRWLGIEWLPAQIQLVNPLFILTFIPLFTYLVYPAIHRVFPLTPIRKIGIGLFLMVLGFGTVAVVQQWIDAGERPTIGWQILAFALLTASEVMVSIVCLEFSYTQAPKAMKSWVMALFLLSVSIGNLFTAGVNHFIQVPNQLAAIEAGESESRGGSPLTGTVTHPGHDEKSGTADDIVIEFADGKRSAVTFASAALIQPIAEKIEAHIRANEWTVPDAATGQTYLAGTLDPWGRPLQYLVVNSHQCRVFSIGPDGEPLTRWDEGVTITVEMPEPAPSGWLAETIARWRPADPWLDRRKQALGLQPEIKAGETREPSVSIDRFVGGQTRLQGAAYFWFFTWIMLGTAALYVVVAWFYKPREYFHDEIPEEEGIVEAIQ